MTSIIFGKRGKKVKNIGIVCEYNPLHNGHVKQLGQFDDTICLMSGNFVQRGEPAILDKYIRARAAVECGASLVLELPITYALSSAEGFADGAVEIFSRLGCVEGLCFGSESGDINNIMSTAKNLLHPNFSEYLHEALLEGVSFPAARAKALAAMGVESGVLEKPNDILAVEYCKALLKRESSIEPITILREGCYHTGTDRENPSAGFLRAQDDWSGFVPERAWELFRAAPRYTLAAGERAMLARLRSMTQAEFERLPYGSEGLWSKLMRACRTEANLQDIITAVKSKRYTHTRLMRMLMCAFLDIEKEPPKPDYVRVLAFDDRGRALLRKIRDHGEISLVNAGEMPEDATYFELERRASDLYGLFCQMQIAQPNREREMRVFYNALRFY